MRSHWKPIQILQIHEKQWKKYSKHSENTVKAGQNTVKTVWNTVKTVGNTVKTVQNTVYTMRNTVKTLYFKKFVFIYVSSVNEYYSKNAIF